MKTISNLIYYSCMIIYILFFICSFIVIANCIFSTDLNELNIIVGLAMTILSFLILATVLIVCILGMLYFDVFLTKNQIEEYLTDKFNRRKLPF